MSARSSCSVSLPRISAKPATDSPMRSDSCARRLHAILRQQVDLALQPRNQVDLRRVQRDRREPEPQVLVEDEDE